MKRVAWFWAWVGVCCAAASAACAQAWPRTGATFDEPFYVAKGLDAWRTGSNKALMTAGTMPLPVDAQTLPLYLWERRRGEPFHAVNDFARLLPVARAANLPFLWLLIAYAGLWGRRAGDARNTPPFEGGRCARSAWPGVFAAGFVAAEPNVLAHAALATTDVAGCATVLAAAYHFHAGRHGRWRVRVLLPGLVFALALAAKASALAFGPILFVAPALASLPAGSFRRAAFWPATWPLRRDAAQVCALGLAGVLVYCGTDWSADPSFVAWAAGRGDSLDGRILRWAAEHLRVFPNGGEGLVQQVKHNLRGHGAYVLGEYHPRAVWYYFPAALSAKLALPTLALAAATLAVRPRSPLTPAGLAVLALLAFSLNCRVQIGVRLVMPLVVLIHVWCAAGWGPGWGLVLRAAALGWLAVTSADLGADRLRAVNALHGGPPHAREVLADSNCDWGQGLPDLARWHAGSEYSAEPCYVWYYGADPAVLLSPFQAKMAHTWPDPTPERLTRETGNGVVAVSVSLLDACPDRRPGTLELLAWLKTREVVGRTGCFEVYRLR